MSSDYRDEFEEKIYDQIASSMDHVQGSYNEGHSAWSWMGVNEIDELPYFLTNERKVKSALHGAIRAISHVTYVLTVGREDMISALENKAFSDLEKHNQVDPRYLRNILNAIFKTIYIYKDSEESVMEYVDLEDVDISEGFSKIESVVNGLYLKYNSFLENGDVNSAGKCIAKIEGILVAVFIVGSYFNRAVTGTWSDEKKFLEDRPLVWFEDTELKKEWLDRRTVEKMVVGDRSVVQWGNNNSVQNVYHEAPSTKHEDAPTKHEDAGAGKKKKSLKKILFTVIGGGLVTLIGVLANVSELISNIISWSLGN